MSALSVAPPRTEFDPYTLQQASCRASHLVNRGSCRPDDWEDARQELVVDFLERAHRFNPARGEWPGFVRGVIRHRSFVLARKEALRRWHEVAPECSDDVDAGANLFDHVAAADQDQALALVMRMDVARILSKLPENLRALAWELTERSVGEIAQARGVTPQWICQLRKRLRLAFLDAGITPQAYRRHGGAQ
jgi:DNA-directed RNA polymerase specialized sigma24 family protein